MRKYIKKQILQEIKLLMQTGNILRSVSAIRKNVEVIELLIKAQDIAVSIGNRIEEAQGQGTRAVSLLEEYCELVWKLSQTTEEWNFYIQRMEEILKQVKSDIEKYSEQYDILFLPYKASMWDSMESVWMAAKEDKDCQCYVMPIPYFDLDAEGKPKKIHYEASMMPSYVPITHYNDYNITEKHPEIIYIHNPYDDCNRITTVHPNFYSAELKKYTDMLVYIPYYLSTYHLPKEHALLPAYVHADRIVLQNDRMKSDIDSSIPREKLVALGNPKADRIWNLEQHKEDVWENRIPASWKRIIQGKKVFLFNVSVTGILNHSNEAMDKIRYVLSKFQNREDAVLLWRPHPLIEITLQTMRPALYKEYMQIKEKFAASGQGILDENGDPGVAVAVADAYIGEGTSSLVNYFGVLGKPILLTDWSILEETTKEERSAIPTIDCFYEKDGIYFVSRKKQVEHELCRIDMTTGKVSVEANMPGKPQNDIGSLSYCDITCYQDWIVLAAYNASGVYLYNRKQGNAIELIPKKECKGFRFDRTIEYKGKLILLPRCYLALAECDVQTMQLEEYDLENTGFTFNNLNKPAFIWAYARRENFLYMAGACEAKMLIYNLDTHEYSVKQIGNYDFGFASMVYDGEFFWLSAWKKSCIVKWEEATGNCQIYEYSLEKQENTDVLITNLVDNDDSLLLFYNVQQTIAELDKATGEITPVFTKESTADKEGKILGRQNTGFSFAKLLDDHKVVTFNQYDYSFYVIDRITKQYKIYPCRLDNEDLYASERRILENAKIKKDVYSCLPEWQTGITEFLDYVVHHPEKYNMEEIESYKEALSGMLGDSGEAIHKYIKACNV